MTPEEAITGYLIYLDYKKFWSTTRDQQHMAEYWAGRCEDLENYMLILMEEAVDKYNVTGVLTDES